MTATDLIEARFIKGWDNFTLNVDLALPATGITALFGHSGSGKTTLLRCFAGLGRQPQGYCRVKGQIWQDQQRCLPSHQRPIGYVFQDANLFPHLSVLKNLQYGQNRQHQKQRIALQQAIDLLGIGPLLARKPADLSGGEKQRVGIARALAVNPELLLMDEPLAALDLPRKREILPYLENLHRELKIPILYVTHSPDEVARLADYLVMMADGQVQAQGPMPEIMTHPDVPIRLAEEAGVVLNARVSGRDPAWDLMQVAFSGGQLWCRDHRLPLDTPIRVRLLARDISLSLDRLPHCSIQNHLPGELIAIRDDEHPGIALAEIRLGNDRVLARLTRRAVHQLNLTIGNLVWVQIKSVALVE